MDLYKLLPAVIRFRDSMTKGTDAEGIVERIIYALEQDSDVTAQYISGLLDLINPDECDSQYLLYISLTLGFAASNLTDPDPKFTRWFVKNLIAFYKIKGTRFSWEKQWAYVDLDPSLSAWELWKLIPYERGDYFRYGDNDGYYGIYHAARVDVFRTISGNPVFASVLEAMGLMETIEWVRPIHVLLRKNYHITDIDDVVDAPLDDSIYVNTGLGVVEDVLEEASDALGITVTCVSTCESVCEAGEETGCLTACEVDCEPSQEAAPGPPGPSGADGRDGCDVCEWMEVTSSIVGELSLKLDSDLFTGDPNHERCWAVGEKITVTIEARNFYAEGEILGKSKVGDDWIIVTDIIAGGFGIVPGDEAWVCHSPAPCPACEESTVSDFSQGAAWMQFVTERPDCWRVNEPICVSLADPLYAASGPISAINKVGAQWVVDADIALHGIGDVTGKAITVCHGVCSTFVPSPDNVVTRWWNTAESSFVVTEPSLEPGQSWMGVLEYDDANKLLILNNYRRCVPTGSYP